MHILKRSLSMTNNRIRAWRAEAWCYRTGAATRAGRFDGASHLPNSNGRCANISWQYYSWLIVNILWWGGEAILWLNKLVRAWLFTIHHIGSLGDVKWNFASRFSVDYHQIPTKVLFYGKYPLQGTRTQIALLCLVGNFRTKPRLISFIHCNFFFFFFY